jgi:hypothetical protein
VRRLGGAQAILTWEHVMAVEYIRSGVSGSVCRMWRHKTTLKKHCTHEENEEAEKAKEKQKTIKRDAAKDDDK